jgi:tRNA (adenine57-N1/adenine58-N1)-methyltransferase
MTAKDNFPDNDIIVDDSYVLVVLDERKRWLTKASKGKQFQTHKGYFEFDDIIGKPYGIKILSSKNTPLYIFKPIPSDLLSQVPHSSQIIYPKDAGLILLYGGISPGSKVIEAGTGSGALTSILANYVRPNGHVYTYEIREDAFKTSMKNIENLNLEKYVTIKKQDASLGFDEKHADSIVLDLGDPWQIVPHAYDSLRASGSLSIFLPTYNQVEKTIRKLKESYFGDIIGIELIEREIQLKPEAIRPKTRMIGHTGFIIFARKMTRVESK